MPTSLPVLVLNASYEPIHICSVKRAILMIFTEKAFVVEVREIEMRSPSTRLKVPSVIRLAAYVRIPYLDWVFNRRNVFLRDDFTCQYCGTRGTTNELTLDHVIPRSRGGRTTWENVVTCCTDCNNKKADRMPGEAGFHLNRAAKRPGSRCILLAARYADADSDKWRRYLFIEHHGWEHHGWEHHG
jgi:5-methylcytosine-specific restriction endonuclease McrA